MPLRFVFLLWFFAHDLWCYGIVPPIDSIPVYYDDILSETVTKINSCEKGVASFVFITDTHAKTNRMQAPRLIYHILEHTNIENVIWGGDAIEAYGTAAEIEEQWQKHDLFDSLISQKGHLYKLRGNHDFTVKEKESDKGVTYSQIKTAQMLLKGHPPNIVLNSSDPGACYYYFDDKSNHLRYIVFDTTDSIKSEDVAWGTIIGVHDRQLQWIVDSAISTIPPSYDFVFLSHIPFADARGSMLPSLKNVCEVVDAVSKKAIGKAGNVNYDFTKLKKTSVLMCLSGHKHQDTQTYRNGTVYMVTACDAAYSDFKLDPFVRDLSGRTRGTAKEQCFDCVVINRKKKLISVYRVGIGGDRFFHIKPIESKVGEHLHLKTLHKGSIEWHSYNASGNQFNKKWTLLNDVVSIDNKGTVICIKPGEAVALAMDKDGNKEFYNIIVK